MQKSSLHYGEIIFQSKVIPLFLPKCSKFHHSEMYTINYGILSTLLVETVGKKRKTAKHGEMRWTPKQ